MKVLVCSDIHERVKSLEHVIKKFLEEKYDKLIFLGDYFDSYFSENNVPALEVANRIIAIKKQFPDQVVLLLGNHDLNYLYDNPYYRCSGFDATKKPVLQPILKENESLFQVAYQINKGKKHYLFTHAGVCSAWFNKYRSKLEMIKEKFDLEIDLDEPNEWFADLLNIVNYTSNQEILHEVGVRRGGTRGDYGGITWCDMSEMEDYGPIKDFHQIVGHTPQRNGIINKVEQFGRSKFNNTSVTFCDVLNEERSDTFLTIEI